MPAAAHSSVHSRLQRGMEGGGGGAEGEGSAFRPRAFVRCDRTGVDCLGSEPGALATLWYLEAAGVPNRADGECHSIFFYLPGCVWGAWAHGSLCIIRGARTGHRDVTSPLPFL